MAQNADWYPGSRTEQLAFTQNMLAVLRSDTKNDMGETVKRHAAWGIPAEKVNELTLAFDAARSALQKAENEETRTHAATAACETTFGRMEDLVRDMKRHFFHETSLSREDFALLKLKYHEAGNQEPAGAPDAQMEMRVSLKGMGYHQLRAMLALVSGDMSARNNRNCHYHIRYGVFNAGDKPPESWKDLPEYKFTKRMRGKFEFDTGDSGKTAYFCVRLENGERKGPWGPITSARIP